MARSVELTPPPRRGERGSTSPHEEDEDRGIRAVNPSPAVPPARRVLRLSTRAQTPSAQRSLSWAIVKEPTAATTLSSSLNPTSTVKTPPATATTTATGQKKSRRVVSEPMLSKLYTSRTATTSHRAREQQVNLSPLAASAGSRRTTRTFDFHRATKAALASSDGGHFSSPPHPYARQRQVAPASPSPAIAAGAHHHLKKTNNNNTKRKTRTPRKAPSNVAAHPHPHPPSLVKSMLGLAARAVKAFSTARGRRRSMLLSATAEERDKLLLAKIRSGIEPAWTDDDDAHDDGQKPGQISRNKVSPKAAVMVKKRTRVSNGSARSRLAREEEEEADTVRSPPESAPPRTPRIGSSVTAGRRQRVGTTTTSSSAKRHPSSSGGGASTFRASSSRKRVRVGGRPSLSSSVSASGRTIYPSSVLSSSAAILNRARPVSRSEALVGEYTARAILRSSVNGGGGGANELLRSSTRSTTTSYHYYRPMTGEIGDGETEEGEEEWVEEARLDEFGAALPTSGHDTQVRESETCKYPYIAHLERQRSARGRFNRSLAPSPISIRTVVRNPLHSRAVNSDEKQQQQLPSTRNSSVLSLRDLSHCAVADESQLLPDEDGDEEDNSASSPLSAFVRQLAKATAAQSSSQDGDVEDFSASGEGGGGIDSPTPTSTSDSEAAGPFSSSPASRSRAFRLPEWLPFASAAAEWTRDQSSEDENGDGEAAPAADEDPLPSPFEDASKDVSEAGEEGAGAGVNAASMRLRSPPPPRRRGRGPTASPLVLPRQVDSADLASARLVGARRLSRELATTASLAAVLKRSNSKGSGDGGNSSAPVSPTTFGEDGPLHGSSSPHVETSHLTEFGSASVTGSGGGRIGSDLSQETLRPSSPSSSRLPSLSPVSPFKFRFSSDSSPAAAAAAEDAIDPSSTKTMKTTPPPVPSRDLRHSYRELTRRSADFALPSSPPASQISAAAMRETALEVFGRVPPAATNALPSSSGADANSNSNSKQQDPSLALRRTIRPGDDASLGRTDPAGQFQEKKKQNDGTWEIYRDEVVDESYAKGEHGSLARRSGAIETSEAEAGVLAERTEASMLRKLAAIRSRGGGGGGGGGGARARFGTQEAAVARRSGDSAEEEAEGEKENVRGYFSA